MADDQQQVSSAAQALNQAMKDAISPLLDALEKNTAAKVKPPTPPKDPFKESLKDMEKQIKEYSVKQAVFNRMFGQRSGVALAAFDKIGKSLGEYSKVVMDAINDARKMGLDAQQGIEFSAKAELEAFKSIFDGFDADTMFSAEEIQAAGQAAADAFGGFSAGLEPSAKGLSQFRENLQSAGIQGAPTAETFKALAMAGATSAESFQTLRAATGRQGIAVNTLSGIINKNVTSVNIFGASVLKRALDFDRLGINLDSLNKGAESYVTSLDQQIDAVAQLGQLGTQIDFEKLTMLQEFGAPGEAQKYIASLINSEDLRSSSYRALLGQISGINVEEIIKVKNAGNFETLQASVTDAATEGDKLGKTLSTLESIMGSFGKAIDIIRNSSLIPLIGSIITTVSALGTFIASLRIASAKTAAAPMMGPALPPGGLGAGAAGAAAPTGVTYNAATLGSGARMGAKLGVVGGLTSGFVEYQQSKDLKKAFGRGLATFVGSIIGGSLGSFIPIPGVGTLLGAAAGQWAANWLFDNLVSKADDMISSPGYGNRALVTPTGTFALNNSDTIMAGTNLLSKGSLQSPSSDNSRLLEKIDKLVDIIQNATTTINVGGQVQKVPRFQLAGVYSRNELV